MQEIQNVDEIKDRNRRAFFKTLGLASTAAAATSLLFDSSHLISAEPAPGVMSPNEDLMQEHALLNRVLLIYEEAIRRLQNNIELDPILLKRSANVIKIFVEGYHEISEEDYVFPRFERVGKFLGLVKVLREQHKAGRILTERILSMSNFRFFRNDMDGTLLINTLHSFIRMYRPHEAREGSVLYPAFRDLLSPQEFNDLGEFLERREHEVLGPEGFEGQVVHVEDIEKKLGIFDLGQFTPRT